MKLKDININSPKNERDTVRKFTTADEALKSKHDLAREFFKKVHLPK